MRLEFLIRGAVVAAACVLAVGGVIGYVTLPALKYIWREENAALSWAALVVNVAAQFLAVWIIYLFYRRSSGRRAEILHTAFTFAFGYTAVAFLVTLYGAIASPLAIFLSNTADIEASWPVTAATIIVPVAIAAVVLSLLPRGGHAAQS